MHEKPLILPAGDQAIVVELGSVISPEVNRRVHGLMSTIEQAGIPGVLEMVPTYRSLLVYYDPMTIAYADLRSRLGRSEHSRSERSRYRPRTIHIPTRYGGEHGPDLEFVAEHAGLTADEVIGIHSGIDYLVYMMGFSPGFPYLGGLDERLNTPRLETPRTENPPGSVGIAESQTGVYPVATPGGWRLIGRTPLKLFDPTGVPPTLLSAGDFARFVPIATDDEYADIQRRVERGEFQTVTEAAR